MTEAEPDQSNPNPYAAIYEAYRGSPVSSPPLKMPTTSREKLQALLGQIEAVEGELAVERARLGTQAADEGWVGSDAHDALAWREKELDALRAGVSLLQERIKAEDQAAEAEKETEDRRKRAEIHAAQVSAAMEVDRALAALGTAWSTLIAAGSPLRTKTAIIRACLHHWAPHFAADLGVHRPQGSALRKPLGEYEMARRAQ